MTRPFPGMPTDDEADAAWVAGQTAALQGHQRDANPYVGLEHHDEPTRRHSAALAAVWGYGFNDGLQGRQQYLYGDPAGTGGANTPSTKQR